MSLGIPLKEGMGVKGGPKTYRRQGYFVDNSIMSLFVIALRFSSCRISHLGVLLPFLVVGMTSFSKFISQISILVRCY